jgi:adenylyltransferase/sulfurtransferase
MTENELYERYQRQLILKGFGESGQRKLLAASVLVIGAGGLGCPALQYLVAAGIGNIGIVDDDTVALSNLHRQVLYTTGDTGFAKASKAKERLQQLNPNSKIDAYEKRLTTENAFEIIKSYDIVIDGTDNFATRYMINDACVLLNKPLVYGAVSQFEGQVAIFNTSDGKGTKPVNYRDLFPVPPKDGEVLNCAEAGVLGVLPGIIGTMQASETIKLITGIGKPLINSLLTYNAANNQAYTIALRARENSTGIPVNEKDFQNTNYEGMCNRPADAEQEIDANTFNDLLDNENVGVIDVREVDELPLISEFAYQKLPLSQLRSAIPAVEKETLILFCQSGQRSLQAARLLSGNFGTSKKIYSLKGGILNWLKSRQTITSL